MVCYICFISSKLLTIQSQFQLSAPMLQNFFPHTIDTLCHYLRPPEAIILIFGQKVHYFNLLITTSEGEHRHVQIIGSSIWELNLKDFVNSTSSSLRKFQHGAFASKLCAQRKRLHCRLGDSWQIHSPERATHHLWRLRPSPGVLKEHLSPCSS